MKAIIFTKGSELQIQRATAMKSGMQRHGVASDIRDVRGETQMEMGKEDFFVCWGKRSMDWLRTWADRDVLVMELGYMMDRLEWTSLGWNGLNGRASFPEGDSMRWRKHFGHLIVGGWRTGGEYALVLGQVAGDASLDEVDYGKWKAQVMTELGGLGNGDVRYRPHPLEDDESVDLEEDLEGARFAVTFNSNSAVDAVLAGIPTVVYDQGSMAWPVAGHRDLMTTVRSSRNKWAQTMAWTQWTLSEIASGEAWEAVRSARSRPPFHEVEC